MIHLYQITGSSSFAARAALEEAGADYEVVNVPPKQRDLDPSFAEANPLQRVPAMATRRSTKPVPCSCTLPTAFPPLV